MLFFGILTGMKTKIVIHKGGWLKLVVAEPNLAEFVLMQSTSYIQNQHYQIWDFRYSKAKTPSVYGDFNDQEILEIDPKYLLAAREIFNFEFTEEDGRFYWFRNDGVLLSNCDRPLHSQTGILQSPRHVWSYAAVREKFREAKAFYENLEFHGDWNVMKLDHIDLNPNYHEMKQRLEFYIQHLNRGQ